MRTRRHSVESVHGLSHIYRQNRDLAGVFSADVGRGLGETDEAAFNRSYRAFPLVAHARAADGAMVVGYVSAFSDGAFSTLLGELAVHPAAQGLGVGRALMQCVEAEFPGVPIYVKAMGDAKHFFAACGYRVPQAEMTVMFKRPPPAGRGPAAEC